MPRLKVLVYDSLHDEYKMYKGIDIIEIDDASFNLKEHYDDGDHVYVFSTRYSIAAITLDD